MTKLLEVYKCNLCGNIVEVVNSGLGDFSCCGTPMILLREGSTDASTEKHVPAITKTPKGYLVKVGSVPHPMEEAHWIQWIELVADGKSYKQFLHPGEAPEAEFFVESATNVFAREYCNLHGLWKALA